MRSWIWQDERWTERLRWDPAGLLSLLGDARRRQGLIRGKASQLGLDLGRQIEAEAVAQEALKTASIEGEVLDPRRVRSSVARQLGLPTAGLPAPDRRTDGLVQILLDATVRHALPLTEERICGWQAAPFPTGYSGLHTIEVGRWRSSPMQVVSGPIGRERVHFEAPPAERVPAEMGCFLKWFESPAAEPRDGLLRAALAHFWFVTVHPFADGNGRIGRALADMLLARDEGSSTRLYSMSRQIEAERDGYYSALARSSTGDSDLTGWMTFFLGCLSRAIERSLCDVEAVLAKARFWMEYGALPLTERQRKVLNALLDAGPGGFEGGITTRKYVSMTRASRATAQRELAELVSHGLLRPRPGAGRSASYELATG